MCAKKFIYLIIKELCKNHVSLTVQFFDTTVHFLYTILLSSLHYLPVSVTLSSSFCYIILQFLLHIPPHFLIHIVWFISYNLMFFTFIWCKVNGYTMQSQWIYRTKAKDKWDESKAKIGRNPFGSHAASTVVNMENGRCSCLQRPLWTWKTVDVRWLSQCLCPIFSMVSSNSLLCFVR